MDKKKRIEEMASDIDYACVELTRDQRVEVARVLTVLSYRKILENAVVLTEENKQLEEEIDLEVDLQTQRKRQIIAESQEFIDELANKNAELQKQVNELKERAKIDLENERNWGKIQTKQAVKDTAKEILAKAPTETNADEMFIHWLRERYGVGVE